MHIIIGALAAIASFMFYLKWISKGANEAVDAANELRNLTRKMRTVKRQENADLNL